jgi:hypothetical protein
MAGVPSEKNTQTTMSTNNNNHNIQQNTNNETSDQQLQHSITPFLKVRAIFSWIASHIAYDIELFESGLLFFSYKNFCFRKFKNVVLFQKTFVHFLEISFQTKY